MEISSSWLGLLGALVNFSGAAGFFLRSRRRLKMWTAGEGRITAMVQHGGGKESPVVTFSDSDGHQHEFKNYLGGSNWYRVGSRVNVLYDPDQPGRAQINDWSSLWSIAAIGLGTGTLFSIMSFLLA